MFGPWMGDNKIKLNEDKDDELMYVSKRTVISMLRQKEKGINSLMQSRKKWKNRYYKILKQLREKEKIIDLMSEQLTTPIHSKECVKEYYKRRTKEI